MVEQRLSRGAPVSQTRADRRFTSGRHRRLATVELLDGRMLLSGGLGHQPSLAHPHAEHLPAAHLGAAGSARAVGMPAREISNLVYLNQGGRQEHLDLYLPSGPAPAGGRPVILALPGGGWRWVRRSDLGSYVAQFTRQGFVVAVADYAFASSTPGTHIYPTNIEDVRQAVRWLKTNASKFGIDPNRVAVWGESAGGNLASLLGTYPDGPFPDSANRDSATPTVSANVQAVIDFYGPTDLAALYQQATKDQGYLQTFLGGTPEQYPARYDAASPVTHVSAGDPPFLIFQGSIDTAVPQAQSIELAQKLRAAGVPVQLELLDLPHGFRPKLTKAVDYTPVVLSFLEKSLNLSAAG